MNSLSRWMRATELEHPLRSVRALSAAHVFILGAAILTSCDSPPSNLVNTNNESDASPPQRWYCSNASDVWTNHGCVSPAVIKLNSVGYLTGRNKIATVPADVSASTFSIVDVTTQQQVYSGSLSANTTDVPDTGDTVRFADFSDFDVSGTYVLQVQGVAASPQFEIGDSVYNDILNVTLQGLYGQRCGTSVRFDYDGDTFSHAACHKNDAQFNPAFTSALSGTRVATGGWHDAGDYGKYTVNGAFSVAFLLKAWEDFGTPLANVNHLPGYSASLPSILAEAKYELDWLLKMQSSNGSVLLVVSTTSFPGDSMAAEADMAPRYFLDVSTGATSYFVAVASMASRVFRNFDSDYADSLLSAARNGMTWLTANPSDIQAADGTQAAPFIPGGPYNVAAGTPSAPRTWAAVELWRASGDGDLPSIESALASMSAPGNWDWPDPRNFAVNDYAAPDNDYPASDSALRDTATVTTVQNAIISAADTLAATAQTHGYGRALGANDYYWGSNGLVARSVMNLQAAYRITGNSKYLDAATLQVDYLLGRNPFGRSMVTGLGYAPPVFPHHRPSNADSVDEPWPGLLVGGPNKDQSDPNSINNPDLPAASTHTRTFHPTPPLRSFSAYPD